MRNQDRLRSTGRPFNKSLWESQSRRMGSWLVWESISLLFSKILDALMHKGMKRDLLLTLVVLRVARSAFRGYGKSTRYATFFSFFLFGQNADSPSITSLVHASHFVSAWGQIFSWLLFIDKAFSFQPQWNGLFEISAAMLSSNLLW